ncbi:uncharacterized protein LOC131483918 [Neofelis nebulosa]|uniref:uncharacterized protein LOC131483918 n=1 Tax=Neofelis nebulosa TaxID=61452 RepID=UPI00272A17A7|nr:uncharacterized protein LOC131483918 [Neofelis nebulosa]
MAASGSPGPTRVPARRKPRRPAPPPPAGRLPAVGDEEMKLPPDGPVGGGCGGAQSGESGQPSRSRRGGGGYRSALRPIVSLPRGSRRSRAREPGSSPARHLLPPLWKRPPPPRAARPGPRLRAAGPARLTGRRQPSPLRPRPPPSWRGRAALSRRHVRAAPAFPPAAGARFQGCGVRTQLPGIPGWKRRL